VFAIHAGATVGVAGAGHADACPQKVGDAPNATHAGASTELAGLAQYTVAECASALHACGGAASTPHAEAGMAVPSTPGPLMQSPSTPGPSLLLVSPITPGPMLLVPTTPPGVETKGAGLPVRASLPTTPEPMMARTLGGRWIWWWWHGDDAHDAGADLDRVRGTSRRCHCDGAYHVVGDGVSHGITHRHLNGGGGVEIWSSHG
jgi:hypothetical protein